MAQHTYRTPTPTPTTDRRAAENSPHQPTFSNQFALQQLGSKSTRQPVGGPPIGIEDYLQIVERIEAFYGAQTSPGSSASGTTVSGMRDLYGYEGGVWERMIPDAENIQAPTQEDVPGIDRLFQFEENGGRRSRPVALPNGEMVDPGHLYTGIDATRFPGTDAALAGYGIDNQDASTWSGDVGQAIVLHDERDGALNHQEAFDQAASIGDLNADLDGVVLGEVFDPEVSLTEQLRSYYTDPEAEWSHLDRFSNFADFRGLETSNNKLSESSEQTIRHEVDNFAEAYGRRNDGALSRILGLVDSNYDEQSSNSIAMTNRFIDYMNSGLSRESERD